METLIIPGVVGSILLIFIVINWNGNCRNKVMLTTFDWSSILSRLKRRKNVHSNYRGHSIRFDTFTAHKNKNTVSRSSRVKYVESTRLVVEPDNHIKRRHLSIEPSEKAITHVLIPNELRYKIKGEIFVATGGCRIIYTQPGIETDENYLKFLLDMLIDLIETYPAIIAIGSEAIDPLLSIYRNTVHPLRMIVPQILRDIELDTATRLSSNPARFVCLRCLVRCASRKTQISWGKYIRYYGCRVCGQSRDVVDWQRSVVAVLDNEMTKKQIMSNGILRGNWLIQRTLFDFDEVQIVRATDEDVERFCVKVGNDTDKTRENKYRQMPCTVSSGCELSENTLKILDSMFGKVEIVELIP